MPGSPATCTTVFSKSGTTTALIGLAVILAMHYWIIRNLVRVMRIVSLDDPLHTLAAGCFAVYLDILINGMVSRTFGSRPDATFMMLFSLIFVADRLLQAAEAKRHAIRKPPSGAARRFRRFAMISNFPRLQPRSQLKLRT